MKRVLRGVFTSFVAAATVTVALTGTASAGIGERNYEASHYPKNSAGYSLIDAWIVPTQHCDHAPYSGYIAYTFEGRWPVNGPAFLRRITIRNLTAQPYDVNYLRHITKGSYFDLPAPFLPAGKTWSYAVNRQIPGVNSEITFGSTIATAPCGTLGRNVWVIRP